MLARKIMMGAIGLLGNDWGNWDGLLDGSATLIEATTNTWRAPALAVMSDTEVVAFYNQNSGQLTAAVIDCGASGVTATVGTPDDFKTISGFAEAMSAVKIATDKWLLAYKDRGDSDVSAVVVTYSGGAFSGGTIKTIYAGNLAAGAVTSLCDMGTGYWALAFNGSGATDQGVALLSVSGTTITVEDTLTLSTAAAGQGMGCATYSTTEIVAIWADATATKAAFVSRSGTTLSVDHTLTLVTGITASKECDIAINQTTGVMFVAYSYYEGGSNKVRRSRLAWSGTALSENNISTRSTTATEAETFTQPSVTYLADSYFLLVYNGIVSAADLRREVFDVTGSGKTMVNFVTGYTAAGGVHIATAPVGEARALLAWKRASNADIYCAVISGE